MLLLVLCLAAAGPIPKGAVPPDRVVPAVLVRLGPGPYLVGQGISIEVAAASPAREPIAVEPPRVVGADLLPVDVEPGAIGVTRFVLIPRRAGSIAVPPFRARVGGRQVASRAATLVVAAVPAPGRPPHFLGGVGEFQVSSRVEPAAVRFGQAVEFRIEVDGPAAAGSNLIPNLARWSVSQGSLQLRGATTELDRSDPPARTFRFGIRPTRAGRMTLPPVPVAAYDPASRRYLTRYTPSVALDVAAPPRLDPARVDFGANVRADGGRHVAIVVAIGGLAATGLGWLGISRALRRRRGERPVAWHREAMRLRRAVAATSRPTEAAELVAHRFARVVAAATRRSWAVPTPIEAEAAVVAIAGDRNLADRAGRMMAELDRARFDPEAAAAPGDPERWVAEAAAIFDAIGRMSRRPGWFDSGRLLGRGPRGPARINAGRTR